jgi:hypothetical protein
MKTRDAREGSWKKKLALLFSFEAWSISSISIPRIPRVTCPLLVCFYLPCRKGKKRHVVKTESCVHDCLAQRRPKHLRSDELTYSSSVASANIINWTWISCSDHNRHWKQEQSPCRRCFWLGRVVPRLIWTVSKHHQWCSSEAGGLPCFCDWAHGPWTKVVRHSRALRRTASPTLIRRPLEFSKVHGHVYIPQIFCQRFSKKQNCHFWQMDKALFPLTETLEFFVNHGNNSC